MRSISTILLAGMVWPAAACAPAAGPATGAAGAVEPHGANLVPPGYGTLRQDEFTVSLRDGALLIKVTPLAEGVIRLAAPDTYDRLHALAESRRAEAQAAAGFAVPDLFLVSFFSYAPDVRFQPDDLRLLHQGRLLRPRAVLPLTPGWGAQLLQQQEVQTAIYGFESIDLDLPLVVRYGSSESDAWNTIVARLRVERAKAQARASS